MSPLSLTAGANYNMLRPLCPDPRDQPRVYVCVWRRRRTIGVEWVYSTTSLQGTSTLLIFYAGFVLLVFGKGGGGLLSGHTLRRR